MCNRADGDCSRNPEQNGNHRGDDPGPNEDFANGLMAVKRKLLDDQTEDDEKDHRLYFSATNVVPMIVIATAVNTLISFGSSRNIPWDDTLQSSCNVPSAGLSRKLLAFSSDVLAFHLDSHRRAAGRDSEQPDDY